MKKEVVIVSALRTPFSKFGGALKNIPTLDLAVLVLEALVTRIKLDKQLVDEIVMGTCIPSETGVVAPVVARQALLKAGFPADTLSMTLDRACCSSSTAVQLGYQQIHFGKARCVISLGAENMSRTPMQLEKLRWGSKIGDVTINDPLFRLGYRDFNPVAVDAGDVALEHGVDRHMQDQWAVQSQQRYEKARRDLKFDAEIIPVPLPGKDGRAKLFSADEFPKPNTTLEALAKLPTIYQSPTVTAGNAPGLDAGAAGVVLMERELAEELHIPILGHLIDVLSVADEPRNIAGVPAKAIQKIMTTLQWSLQDIDLIEINEAFAAMPLVSAKILAENDTSLFTALKEKINVNGGAIAVGHPVGASGIRILMTLMYELRRRGGGKGVAAICGGLAQGDAMAIEI